MPPLGWSHTPLKKLHGPGSGHYTNAFAYARCARVVAPFVERSGDTTFQATANVIFEITADIFDTEFLYDEDPQMWGKGAKGEQKGGKGDWGKGSSS